MIGALVRMPIHATAGNGAIVDESGGDITVPWWSFTKTVIAATALTLVRDGALQLDETLAGAPYTLRQLLQHRAGLTDYGGLQDYQAAVARGDAPWPIDELLSRADAARTRYEPGGDWEYSNIGYLFIRQLIERTLGQPLEVVLGLRIFGPLDIRRPRLAKEAGHLRGVEMGKAHGYHPGWVYHGLLVGPLGDAALLLDRLLGGDLLPPGLLAEMKAPFPVGPAIESRPWRKPAYGLGVMIDADAAPNAPVGHSGDGPGSVIAVYRGERTAAVFSTEANVGEIESIAFRMARSRGSATARARD